MKTIILGAGGIGGYLAARMAQKGHAPTLLLRKQTARHIEDNDLKLQSSLGDWSGPLPIESATSGDTGTKAPQNPKTPCFAM